MMRIFVAAAMCCTLVAGLSVSPALAQSSGPTQSYSSTPIPLPNTSGVSASQESNQTATNEASTNAEQTQSVSGVSGRRLPFTGIDVRLLILGGLTLIGTGLGLRRGSRAAPHPSRTD